MKRTPLMFAALVPLFATAGESGALQSKVDPQKLEQDIELSKVLGAEVQLQGAAQAGQQGNQQGESSGEVQDVLIASDGRIEAVLIDGLNAQDGGGQSMDQSTGQTGTADEERVSTAQDASGGQTTAASVGTVTDEGLTKVQWDQVSYDPAAETVTVSSSTQGSGVSSMESDASGLQSGSASFGEQGATASSMQASSASTSGGESFEASEIIGMEVHLSDAKSFGEVGDVLINEQEGKASALIVNAWEGFDRQTYALPVELDAVNREDNAIDYSYTESDVIALQEYERE